jgi:hypothetical protein
MARDSLAKRGKITCVRSGKSLFSKFTEMLPLSRTWQLATEFRTRKSAERTLTVASHVSRSGGPGIVSLSGILPCDAPAYTYIIILVHAERRLEL